MATEIHTINKNQYYSANDVYNKNNSFFYGCANNPRNIVTKKNLPVDTYLYAYTKNNDWVVSNKSYCKAKLYLQKEWVDINIQGFDQTKNIVADIEMPPPLIALNNGEYFINTDGNQMNIKIRGDRDKKEFYFSVQDVANCFNIPTLVKYLAETKSTYILNEDYKMFFIKNSNTVGILKSKFSYFTYDGLIKCLYISRSKEAKKFQSWASKILFIHQFGSKTEKRQLASSLLGVHAEAVRQVFKASATSVPCIYLFTLGTVKELRQSMNIDIKYNDNMIICKYGKTDNLERRTGEHIATYGSIENSNLALKYYSYIDPKNISDAETDIRNFMNAINAHIEYKNHVELVILEPKMLYETVNKQYTAITKVYAGNISDLLVRIKNLEDELLLEKEKNKRVVVEKDYEILTRDKRIMDLEKTMENELLKKEIELLKLKLK